MKGAMNALPKRILIVDDDTDLREALTDALTDAGYVVTGASNGREGLDRLSDGQAPCAVLLDLLMPVMNGWEFCAAVKSDPATAQIPIVGMSGAVSRDPKSPYFIAVDDFVAKPINMTDLLGKLRKCQSDSLDSVRRE
jgi:CheY-like chemotaxis protein